MTCKSSEFLHGHGYEKMEKILIDTIVQLARPVLQENNFFCDKKFYRQITSDAMGSSFTLTSANIFMLKWRKVRSSARYDRQI